MCNYTYVSREEKQQQKQYEQPLLEYQHHFNKYYQNYDAKLPTQHTVNKLTRIMNELEKNRL